MRKNNLNSKKYVQKFIKDGFVDYGNAFSKNECEFIYNQVIKTRNFSSDIFYNEKNYKRKKA